jgi:hypothetical protein
MIGTKPRRSKRVLRGAAGTLPTLPAGFSGWSLDAQDGLSLYNLGTLIGRYGPQGVPGILKESGGYQPVDGTHRAILRYELPASAVLVINRSLLSFSLKPFRASSQSTSGASSASSSGTQSAAHAHFLQLSQEAATPSSGALFWNGTDGILTDKGANAVLNQPITANQNNDHTHGIPHTHAVNAPDGLYDVGMAQGVHVFVDGTDRTTALGGPWGVGAALDVPDLDISAYITTTGWHEIQLSSTTLGVIIAQLYTKAQLNTA